MKPSSDAPRAVLLGLALLVVAVAGIGVAVNWTELRTRWELRDLERTPDELLGFLASTIEPRRLAGLRYLESAEGKERLFRLYLDEFERTTPQMGLLEFLPRRSRQGATAGHFGLYSSGQIVRDNGGLGSSMGLRPDDPERRRIILEHLDALEKHVFRHESFPGFEFLVVPIDPSRRQMDAPWQDGARDRPIPTPKADGLTHVTFFRVEPSLLPDPDAG